MTKPKAKRSKLQQLSMRKAQHVHQIMVGLGKTEFYKRHKPAK